MRGRSNDVSLPRAARHRGVLLPDQDRRRRVPEQVEPGEAQAVTLRRRTSAPLSVAMRPASLPANAAISTAGAAMLFSSTTGTATPAVAGAATTAATTTAVPVLSITANIDAGRPAIWGRPELAAPFESLSVEDPARHEKSRLMSRTQPPDSEPMSKGHQPSLQPFGWHQ